MYLSALSKSKAAAKLSERPEVFMPDNDGSISDSQSWGLISLDDYSDAINEIKEPPAITHPVFRESCRSIGSAQRMNHSLLLQILKVREFRYPVLFSMRSSSTLCVAAATASRA